LAYALRAPKAQIRRLKQALGACYRVDIQGLLFADLSTPGGRSEAKALESKTKKQHLGNIVGSEQMIGQVKIESRKGQVSEKLRGLPNSCWPSTNGANSDQAAHRTFVRFST
jgi:hypothetical protein